ncbi:interference hedgehog-like isoform X1 [Octopus vulgaris]|uniref:Interference hedgehog-like isoform X1 n=2 Tax=Octopus TaxID=6643 RepID=A0AA36FFL4_OCTVU|nr:contactin-3 [Octopus sinensis]CAI9737256.1 interference hedgehog-like isoform X1 [Octopus vulgaris]
MEYSRRALAVLVLPLLLWIINQHTAESLELVVFPNRTRLVPLGSNLVLNCMALGPGPHGNRPKLVWITPGGKEIDSSFGRLSTNRGYYTSHLYINNISQSDAGRFTCRATGHRKKILEEEHFYLNVYQSIIYVDCPTVQILRKNSSGLIRCVVDATPAVVVSWRLKGRYIYDGPTYAQERNGLRILNVTAEDAAIYTCISEVPSLGDFRTRDIRVRVIDPKGTSGEVRR